MLDRLDQILWLLQRHRVAVLGVLAAVVVLTAVGFLVRGGGSSPSIPKGAVAVVGSQPITRAAFDHWAGVYRRSGVGGAHPTAAQTNKAVLQILVAASWTEQEAARRGVTVANSKVDQAVQATYTQAKAQGVSKATVLQQLGGTEADLRWEERASLLGNALEVKVAKAAKPVTADQIAGQYSAEAVRWAHPTRRDVQVVLTASQSAAAKALSALRAGQGWAAVSRQYGSSQLSSTKTLLTKIHPGTHDAAFERAVFAAPVGRLSGPALVGSGWIVFKVLSSTPLAPTSLQAATPILRSELTATTQNSAVAAYLKSFRTSWRSRTRCAAYLRDAAVCGS